MMDGRNLTALKSYG
jgi:hypothetical protein